ncbi:MAG TPA: hypothetical protein VF605_05430 [Allosphingosinicella sp.]
MATKIGWFLLALVHVSPAAVLFRPGLLRTLYGGEPERATSLLLTHRGAMFLAIVVAAFWAAFDPSVRRLCTVILAISVLGYLVLYARAGMPQGPMRIIAAADAVALAPLLLVTWSAWRPAL